MFDFLKILGKEKGYISSTFLELKMQFKAKCFADDPQIYWHCTFESKWLFYSLQVPVCNIIKGNFVEEKTIKSFGNGTGHIFEYNNAYF